MTTNRPASAALALAIALSLAAASAWADRDRERGEDPRAERGLFQKPREYDRRETRPAEKSRPQESREDRPGQRPVVRQDDDRRDAGRPRQYEYRRDNDRERRERTAPGVQPGVQPRVEPGVHPGVQPGIKRVEPAPRTLFTKPPGYVLDRRHGHDRYYPPHGHVVPAPPPGHRVVPYRGTNYYWHGGIWYHYTGARYVVVRPPIGVVVPILPPYYTTVWVGVVPYYYSAGVYYVYRPEQQAYVVTEAPPEAEIVEPAAVPDQMFIYPKHGQSEEQQATDRYQCHRWAVEQTGFDPIEPGGDVTAADYASKRAAYRRAMEACLEARGYSVK